jgi:hypothetical protein
MGKVGLITSCPWISRGDGDVGGALFPPRTGAMCAVSECSEKVSVSAWSEELGSVCLNHS